MMALIHLIPAIRVAFSCQSMITISIVPRKVRSHTRQRFRGYVYEEWFPTEIQRQPIRWKQDCALLCLCGIFHADWYV